jgi:hypothetical protein
MKIMRIKPITLMNFWEMDWEDGQPLGASRATDPLLMPYDQFI